jgi:hypothetical protein
LEIMMKEPTAPEDRLLSVAEREMVEQTKLPAIAEQSKDALQALGKRLREARDRARRIERQQQREMRGKADPKGATPARDNAGTAAKAQVLVDALKRVTAALRRHTASAPEHPPAGPTASQGMQPKQSRRPTVKADPREVGRVSQAVKVAQAKRDH